jgi:hypothetical protein
MHCDSKRRHLQLHASSDFKQGHEGTILAAPLHVAAAAVLFEWGCKLLPEEAKRTLAAECMLPSWPEL